MQTTKIIPLRRLPRQTFEVIRNGQLEAGKL